LLAEKVRERLAVNKRPVNKMDMQRLNLKKLKEGEVKEQYCNVPGVLFTMEVYFCSKKSIHYS
jgi:hypothetical protein